jgi:hypothetical protein
MAITQSSVHPRFVARPAELITGNMLKETASCATASATRNATQRLPVRYLDAISAPRKCNGRRSKDEKLFNERLS